jgi:hypothetical protein
MNYKRLGLIFSLSISRDSIQFQIFSNPVYRQFAFFNFQPKHRFPMDPKPPSQLASETKTPQSYMTLDEVLSKIQPFLDISTPISSNSNILKSFEQHYAECMEKCYSTQWNPIDYLCEQLMFSRGDEVALPTQKDIDRPVSFRPNVSFSLEGTAQPEGMHVHVFTTSACKEILLEEIVSMAISFSTLNGSSEAAHIEALEFLEKLFGSHLRNLKKLKLSGFRANQLFWASLSKLSLDWLHLTSPLLEIVDHCPDVFPAVQKLHMELRKDFCPNSLLALPLLLDELSLHLSSLEPFNYIASVSLCRGLRKM